MAATKVTPVRDYIAELNYWRDIRLDYPDRKNEALINIDRILDDMMRNGLDSR